MVRIGSHVPVGSGLTRGALPFAQEIGADTFQVFVGNPRGWALSKGKPADDEAFRTATVDIPVFVHTPYLVNLGSPTEATFERSIESVRHNLVRAAAIGADGVVVHTGSAVAADGFVEAMAKLRRGLLPLLDEIADDGPRLLLEPTAGQGRSLCAGVEDLPAYLDNLDWHPRLGICLDTCHVFAAGAPLDARGGMKRTLDRLTELAGPGRLGLIHVNDSKDVRGSFRDRHERVGQGHIGQRAFRALVRHPAARSVPLILETPGGKPAYAEDIELLRKLR